MGFRSLTAIAALVFTAAASPPPFGSRLYGLSAGNVSSFNSAPDGCAMSMLFDNWRVERAAETPPRKFPSVRALTFAASPGAHGKSLRLHIRGSVAGSGTAKLILVSGKMRKTLSIPALEGDFLLQDAIAITGSDTRVELTAEFQPEPESPEPALLDIDSIDASLPSCGKAKK